MTSAAIETDDLRMRFGDTTALEGLTLRVEEGELFGLLGPNGAGKSTTIRILCGLLEPTAGAARVGGYALPSEAPAVKEIIGVCPQENGVFPYLTGRENVRLFGELHGMGARSLTARTEELLRTMGLDGEADRKAKGYSGGMTRRISLLMALISDPTVAFLDEPTTGLDPAARRAVWEFLRSLRSRRRTIVLSTHYMEEAEALCDRVAILDRGRLIALGTPSELQREHGASSLEEVFLKLAGRRIREGGVE